MRNFSWCLNWRFVAVGVLAVPILCGPPTQAQQPAIDPLQPQAPGGAANSIPGSGLPPSSTPRSAAQHAPAFVPPAGYSFQPATAGPSIPAPSTRQSADHARQHHDILKKYGETADETQRAALTEQLRQLVDQEFTERQQRRQGDLQRLEEQLNRLRAIHDRRERERNRIVGDRVQQLLHNADGLGWGDESRPEWTLAYPIPTGYGPPTYTEPGAPGDAYLTPRPMISPYPPVAPTPPALPAATTSPDRAPSLD